MTIRPKYNVLSKSFFIDGSFGELLLLYTVEYQVMTFLTPNLVREKTLGTKFKMHQFAMKLILFNTTVVEKHLSTQNSSFS